MGADMSITVFGPMLVLILWTFSIGFMAGLRRVREIRSRRIPLASVARPRDVARVLEDTKFMDNFNNLLQVPLLFYIWCLAMIQWQVSGLPWELGAWAYVALRMTHSVIQVTHNRVMQQFCVWISSNATLLLLWVIFGVHLLQGHALL